MAKQNAKAAANEMQTLFDTSGYQDVMKTWATMNERMASIAVAAGTRVTDIASDSAKEALSNVQELTQVRDEPSDYGKAYMDFVQKQTDLFKRTAQTWASETQKAGNETSDLASKAGEEMTAKIKANAEDAVQTVRSAADKAA